MRRFACVAIAFLAFCWTASPIVACVISGKAMSAQENDCCQHMTEMCNSARMPRLHSCCKTEARPSNGLLVTKDDRSGPTLQMVAALPPPTSREIPIFFQGSTNDRPPTESLSSTTILRI